MPKNAEKKHTARAVRSAIDAAEPELRFCWSVVDAIAAGKLHKSFGLDLLNFQPRLFDAIEALEEVYRAIKQEERRLIQRKTSLNSRWFGQQMARLAARTVSLKEALAIARSIGDGFAWYFYQDERDLIAQHLKLQRQPLLPPKLGRLGERIGLAQMQGIDQKLLIYHGTTTFLRLGDISLVDLRDLRVKCIGEIKTARVDDRQIEVSVSFVAGALEDLPALQEALESPTSTEPVPLTPAMEHRKKRQLRELGNALGNVRAPSEFDANLQGDFLFGALDTVVSQCGTRAFTFVKASDSMAFGAMRIGRNRSLSALLTSHPSPDLGLALADAPRWAIEIAKKGSADNAFYVGSIGTGVSAPQTNAETIPLAMWPAKRETMREIIFGNVVVATLFNPVKILEVLRKRGFEIEFSGNGSVKATKTIGERTVELGNLTYFFNLIRYSLLSEKSVISMLERMLDLAARQGNEGGARRINLRPVISRRPRPKRG